MNIVSYSTNILSYSTNILSYSTNIVSYSTNIVSYSLIFEYLVSKNVSNQEIFVLSFNQLDENSESRWHMQI